MPTRTGRPSDTLPARSWRDRVREVRRRLGGMLDDLASPPLEPQPLPVPTEDYVLRRRSRP